MPPTRERRASRKVRENTASAPLQTPRATPRAPSRPGVPRRSTSGPLRTPDIPSQAENRLRISRAVGPLPSPDDGASSTPGTQVMRDSIPSRPILPTLGFPELLSSESPISDVEMPDLQATPLQSIENISNKGEEEEEEEEDIDYDIEWRVLLGKEPIICDIINRSDFRFFKLCT